MSHFSLSREQFKQKVTKGTLFYSVQCFHRFFLLIIRKTFKSVTFKDVILNIGLFGQLYCPHNVSLAADLEIGGVSTVAGSFWCAL